MKNSDLAPISIKNGLFLGQSPGDQHQNRDDAGGFAMEHQKITRLAGPETAV